VAAAVTVNSTFLDDGRGKFRVGDKIWIGIGTVDEEQVEILTIDSETQLTLVAAPENSHDSTDRIGKKIFGGNVARVTDKNIRVLTQIEFAVAGVDFTKSFDRKNVNDTFEDVDARYIINSAANGPDGINHVKTIDNMDFDDDAAIQAEWIEADDGNNPTIDTVDFIEADNSGVFSWTNTGANEASWSAAPTSFDASEWTGVASGTPTKGQLMVWADFDDISVVTSFKMQVGSASGDQIEVTFTLTGASNDGEFVYYLAKLTGGTVTGTPDWTAVDFAKIIIGETGDGTVKINGFRFVELQVFTFFNFEKGLPLTDYRASFKKPTFVINELAKFSQFFWYIDNDRDIRFFDQETDQAPFSITDTSDNFLDLRIMVDTSNLKNRQVIRGGTKTSDSIYAQIFEGGGDLREWVLKTKFKNLVITIDDNTSTDIMEAGTTTTNVTATAHGLVTDDHIVNRTRSNAVRQIIRIDDDNFTVEAVTGQVSGDTFSKFDTTKTDGVEGFTDEATVDYVSNFQEKSVRATESEATLTSGTFIRFEYNEVIPIRVRRSAGASISRLKALVGGDGIFDGQPITDQTIDSSTMAQQRAQAELEQYSNPITSGGFVTDNEGLKAGQIIRVTDSNRAVDEDFLIQKINSKAVSGEDGSYWLFTVEFASTLFGIVEFFQKLLLGIGEIDVDTEEVVETFVTVEEVVESSEVNQVEIDGGDKRVEGAETVESSEVNTVDKLTTGTWRWAPNGVGQTFETRWDLFDWG